MVTEAAACCCAQSVQAGVLMRGCGAGDTISSTVMLTVRRSESSAAAVMMSSVVGVHGKEFAASSADRHLQHACFAAPVTEM